MLSWIIGKRLVFIAFACAQVAEVLDNHWFSQHLHALRWLKYWKTIGFHCSHIGSDGSIIGQPLVFIAFVCVQEAEGIGRPLVFIAFACTQVAEVLENHLFSLR